MKVRTYTIFDSMAKEYGPLFNAKNNEVAKRMFKQFLTKELVSQEDYTLYCVGEFDTESALLDPCKELIDG